MMEGHMLRNSIAKCYLESIHQRTFLKQMQQGECLIYPKLAFLQTVPWNALLLLQVGTLTSGQFAFSSRGGKVWEEVVLSVSYWDPSAPRNSQMLSSNCRPLWGHFLLLYLLLRLHLLS